MSEYQLAVWDGQLSRQFAVLDECEADSPEVALLKMAETVMAARPTVVQEGRYITLEERTHENVYDTVAKHQVPETRKDLPTLGGVE